MTTDTTVLKDRMEKARAARAIGVNASGMISPADEFAALNSGRMNTGQSGIPGEDAGMTGSGNVPAGTVVHKRPAGVTMYKPDGRGGYTPRLNIPATAITQNLRNGWFVHCPDCGGDHASMDPNECPANDPVKTAFCPICGKQIWDNRVPVSQDSHEDDPNMVRLEFTNSTPLTRLKATMDVHIWTRHPQQARILGLEPLAQAAETAMDVSGV